MPKYCALLRRLLNLLRCCWGSASAAGLYIASSVMSPSMLFIVASFPLQLISTQVSQACIHAHHLNGGIGMSVEEEINKIHKGGKENHVVMILDDKRDYKLSLQEIINGITEGISQDIAVTTEITTDITQKPKQNSFPSKEHTKKENKVAHEEFNTINLQHGSVQLFMYSSLTDAELSMKIKQHQPCVTVTIGSEVAFQFAALNTPTLSASTLSAPQTALDNQLTEPEPVQAPAGLTPEGATSSGIILPGVTSAVKQKSDQQLPPVSQLEIQRLPHLALLVEKEPELLKLTNFTSIVGQIRPQDICEVIVMLVKQAKNVALVMPTEQSLAFKDALQQIAPKYEFDIFKAESRDVKLQEINPQHRNLQEAKHADIFLLAPEVSDKELIEVLQQAQITPILSLYKRYVSLAQRYRDKHPKLGLKSRVSSVYIDNFMLGRFSATKLCELLSLPASSYPRIAEQHIFSEISILLQRNNPIL